MLIWYSVLRIIGALSGINIAFLREEGGTAHAVTEGACVHNRSHTRHIASACALSHALPQSPAVTAPSRREPLNTIILRWLFVRSLPIGIAYVTPRHNG